MVTVSMLLLAGWYVLLVTMHFCTIKYRKDEKEKEERKEKRKELHNSSSDKGFIEKVNEVEVVEVEEVQEVHKGVEVAGVAPDVDIFNDFESDKQIDEV